MVDLQLRWRDKEILQQICHVEEHAENLLHNKTLDLSDIKLKIDQTVFESI